MDLNAISSWNSVGQDLSKLAAMNRDLLRRNNELEKRVKVQDTTSSIVQAGVDPELQRKMLVGGIFLYRVLRRLCKGFMVGYGLRATFGLIPLLLRGRPEGGLRELGRRIVKVLTAEPVRYGLFVGSAVASFEFSMRATRALAAKYPDARTLLCGVLAGPSLLFLPKGDRAGFGVFVAIRGLEVVGNYAVAGGLAPEIPHGDTLLMMAASAQCLSAWIFFPSAHDPGYNKFLDYQGGMSRPHVELFKRHHQKATASDMQSNAATAVLNAAREKIGVAPLDFFRPGFSHRSFMHNGVGCLPHYLHFLKEGMKRALPVYIPVYGLSTVLFRSSALLASPLDTLRTLISNVLRSSLFLSFYCAGSWAGADVIEMFLGRCGVLTTLAAGMLGGSAVLIERKNRRIELGFYVLSHAFKSAYRAWVMWGWVPSAPTPLSEVALFSFGLALLMHAYVRKPLLMRKTYFSLFRFFFGKQRGAVGTVEFAAEDEEHGPGGSGASTPRLQQEPSDTPNSTDKIETTNTSSAE